MFSKYKWASFLQLETIHWEQNKQNRIQLKTNTLLLIFHISLHLPDLGTPYPYSICKRKKS